MNGTTVRRTHTEELRIWVSPVILAGLQKYINDNGLNKNAAVRLFVTRGLRAEGYLKSELDESEGQE